MGVVANIDSKSFPAQSDSIGERAKVCFKYDTSATLLGTVVRADEESPWVTIIRLDDGRHILAGECQYSPDFKGMPAHMRADASPSTEK